MTFLYPEVIMPRFFSDDITETTHLPFVVAHHTVAGNYRAIVVEYHITRQRITRRIIHRHRTGAFGLDINRGEFLLLLG